MSKDLSEVIGRILPAPENNLSPEKLEVARKARRSFMGKALAMGAGVAAAAKAGVAGMTRALARELGSRNITVNCVAPGFIETDMTASLQEDQQKALLNQIPLGHLGKPADIAHAVLYLASPEAAYVTGQELNVNGGMYMS